MIGPTLSLNVGSSSLKFTLFDESETPLCRGEAEEIGKKESFFWFEKKNDRFEEYIAIDSYEKALELLFEMLKKQSLPSPIAIGHRVVHGGEKYSGPTKIDGALLRCLEKLIPFAPLHLPSEIEVIEKLKEMYPNLFQVACFDTAFHTRMPELHQHFPLPKKLWEEGIKRYGFHGLSYEYILSTLGKLAEDKRIIIAHLGNGASMAAINSGKPIDTTMGFTPAGGFMMGTRSGDLDPGILVYLIRHKGYNADQIDAMINYESGLFGISGITGDMKTLLNKRNKEKRANDAVTLFCYELCKTIGALSASLNGLDMLIFTGGIGERAAEVRDEVLKGLKYLGITLDRQANQNHASLISTSESKCEVRIIPTNEDLMIARHTKALMEKR